MKAVSDIPSPPVTSGPNSLVRSRYVASVGESRGVIETEGLEMRKADERFVSLQDRDERERILE